jgi:hypothetical protein
VEPRSSASAVRASARYARRSEVPNLPRGLRSLRLAGHLAWSRGCKLGRPCDTLPITPCLSGPNDRVIRQPETPLPPSHMISGAPLLQPDADGNLRRTTSTWTDKADVMSRYLQAAMLMSWVLAAERGRACRVPPTLAARQPAAQAAGQQPARRLRLRPTEPRRRPRGAQMVCAGRGAARTLRTASQLCIHHQRAASQAEVRAPQEHVCCTRI